MRARASKTKCLILKESDGLCRVNLNSTLRFPYVLLGITRHNPTRAKAQPRHERRIQK